MAGAAYLCFLGVKSLQAVNWQRVHYATRNIFAKRAAQIQYGLSTEYADSKITINTVTDRKLRSTSAGNVLTGWREGFITNCLNPKSSLFYLALFPQFISVGSNEELRSYLLVAIHVAISAMWFSAVTVALAKILHGPRGESFANPLKIFSGIVLILSSGGFAFMAVA